MTANPFDHPVSIRRSARYRGATFGANVRRWAWGAFAQFQKDEIVKWGNAVRASGAKIE